uniref:WSD domain-containing protein n=1 Tax=Parastrongyloides trichosuri TaxID=131310 RepID=A0A0N5A1V1_PARTI
MNENKIVKLDPSKIIHIHAKDPENIELHECVDAAVDLIKHYLFERNFDKAKELVTVFLSVIPSKKINEIDDLILKQFIINALAEDQDIPHFLTGENAELLYDFMTYGTDDNCITRKEKYTLPNLPPLLPRHFFSANEYAAEIALDFLMYSNLNFLVKSKKLGNKYVMNDFISGMEEKDNNLFLNALTSIILKIFKEYEKRDIKLSFEGKPLSKLDLTKNTFSVYIRTFFKAEIDEMGSLTYMLDDDEFLNMLKLSYRSLIKSDFIDLSLSDKLTVLQILFILIVEMNVFDENRKKFIENGNVPQTVIKEGHQNITKIKKQIEDLENEIEVINNNENFNNEGENKRHILNEKNKKLRQLKKELASCEDKLYLIEEKKNFSDFILWNKSSSIIGRDRAFNIYKISIGYDFIYVMKPRNAKYGFSKKEYNNTFKECSTIDDMLISKISPITKMKCDGYDYFYVDTVDKLDKIFKSLDYRGIRERDLIKNLQEVIPLAKTHMENYEKKISL